jgi:predicted outer membrane lipoprotein
MRTLLLMLLGTFLLAAGVITAVWGERLSSRAFHWRAKPARTELCSSGSGG